GLAYLNRDSGPGGAPVPSGAAGGRCARPSPWPRWWASATTQWSAPSTSACSRVANPRRWPLTACMPKLLALLRAVLRDRTPLQPTSLAIWQSRQLLSYRVAPCLLWLRCCLCYAPSAAADPFAHSQERDAQHEMNDPNDPVRRARQPLGLTGPHN